MTDPRDALIDRLYEALEQIIDPADDYPVWSIATQALRAVEEYRKLYNDGAETLQSNALDNAKNLATSAGPVNESSKTLHDAQPLTEAEQWKAIDIILGMARHHGRDTALRGLHEAGFGIVRKR